MPFINIENKKIHYEVHGKGEPLLLLNGMMMNTLSWLPFVKAFLMDYEVILIDLIDQGKSDGAEGPYSLKMHIDTLIGFLDYLKYEKINMLGISYGGEVAMLFALMHKERLDSLILSNTTSNAARDLDEVKNNWEDAAKTCNGALLFNVTSKYMYSFEFYKENFKTLRAREKLMERSLSKDWFDRFRRALDSARNFNVTDMLKNLDLPVLVIGSDLDRVAPVKCQEEMVKSIQGAKLHIIKDSGHAPMYEKPEEYAKVLRDFLNSLGK